MRRDSILIYLTDRLDRAAIAPILERNLVAGEIRMGGLTQALEDAASWRIIPTFLVIDAAGVEDVPAALDDLAARAPDGETSLILIGSENDVRLYRQLKAHGVAEYLIPPVSADDLAEIITAINIQRRSRNDIDTHRVIGFIGARGGVGTSLLAATAARAVAHLHKRKTLLVDLDIEAGAQQVIFDQEQTTPLLDMLENPSRIDSLILERTMVPVSKALNLLSVADFGQRRNLSAEGVRTLVQVAQQGMETIVLEIPARPSFGLEVLFVIGHIFIVSTPTLLGLRDSLHIVNFLEANDYVGNYTVILNRIGETRIGTVKTEEFARRFKGNVIELPFDSRTPHQALMEGKSMLELRGPLSSAFERVIERLPTAPRKQELSFFARLLQR